MNNIRNCKTNNCNDTGLHSHNSIHSSIPGQYLQYYFFLKMRKRTTEMRALIGIGALTQKGCLLEGGGYWNRGAY